MDYEEQLSAAKFRAERDQARQELERAKEELGKLHSDAIARFVVEQSMDNIEREIKLGVNSIAESLGIKDEIQELPIAEVCPRIVAEMEKRLMPEGYEWPRYDTGELVLIGDDVIGPDYGESIHVDEITFHDNGFTVREKTGLDHWYENDDRFKRPQVLASDREPLEVGQTVWTLDNPSFECRVFGFGDGMVHLKSGVDHILQREPSQLTHQRPVLDADGVLIKKGDTVWLTGEPEYSWTVTHVSERHVGGYCNEDGSALDMHSKSLTHAKPEPPDSWERIEEDADALAEAEINGEGSFNAANAYCDRRGLMEGTSFVLMAQDLVRRCKALAEKENGNE